MDAMRASLKDQNIAYIVLAMTTELTISVHKTSILSDKTKQSSI